MYCFSVGINYSVLRPLTIHFSTEVKESTKKKSCFFYFFQNHSRLWFFFFFFNKHTFGGLIPLEKKPFILWLGFFFFFQTNLSFRPYSTGKNRFRIWLDFFFSPNKPVFGGLIPLGSLKRPPNLPYGWASPYIYIYCFLYTLFLFLF